ncbi:MAG: glycosyltransferase family 39 protein [Gemmatimonadaceae bacterium]
MFSDPRVGLPLVLHHLVAIGAATLLTLLHVALGARLWRLMGGGGAGEPGQRWPVNAALGVGVLGTLLLVLGAVRLLHSPVVLVVTAALGVVVWPELRRTAAEFADGLRTGWGIARELRPARALLALVVVLLLAGAVAPPTEWDSLMYHLREPLRALEAGRIILPPDSFHVALIGVAQFATLPLLAAGILVGPALMQVAAILLLMLGTLALARAVGVERNAAWYALPVLLGCPMIILVGITARVDVTLMLMLLAAHLVLLDAWKQERPREVLIAAVIIGFAVGIKPQAGAYALALIPLGLVAARRMPLAIGAAALAIVVFLPWAVKNQLLVGAAFYPKGSPGWFEPWIAELYGSKVPPPYVDQSVLDVLPEGRAEFNILDAFRNPSRLTIEGEGVNYELSPALMLVPLILLRWRQRRDVLALAAVALIYAALVVVPFGRINLRYLMPALPALAVTVAALIEPTTPRFRGVTRSVWIAAVATLALLPFGKATWDRFLKRPVLIAHAVGYAPARQVWTLHPDYTPRILAEAIEATQDHVPLDGKILLLFESRGLAFERDVLADVMLSNFSYLEQSPAAASCLAGSGITHVVINKSSARYYVMRGGDPLKMRLDRLAAFRDRCLDPVMQHSPEFEFWHLRATPRELPPAPPPPPTG